MRPVLEIATVPPDRADAAAELRGFDNGAHARAKIDARALVRNPTSGCGRSSLLVERPRYKELEGEMSDTSPRRDSIFGTHVPSAQRG